MGFTPRSKEFDDVYFSKEDGLAESRFVFLGANGLPEAWIGKPDFTICETGFGTGLNFLAVWKLFKRTAEPGARLEFISFEKFPLTAEEIKKYLEPWRGEFPEELDNLCARYPAPEPGGHTVVMDSNVALTLIFDDVNAAIPELDARIDCWFLDGFKPATNPGMWSETVFTNMARLSKPGATFATFTAAGAVKRGLQAVGFTVEKVKGFGTKRDMLKGTFR